jgi:hypothetical protein
MAKKVKRGRQHARAALHGYRSAIVTDPRAGNPDSDELALLGDLLADLLHLADEIGRNATPGDGYDFTDPSRESAAAYSLRVAESHYRYESDPANADEAV